MAAVLSEADPVHIENGQVDLTAVQHLPDSYAWADDTTGVGTCSGAATDAVPVVDLASDSVVDGLRYACPEWGVFYLANHGIPHSLLDQAEFLTERLFSLPLEEKLKAARSPVPVGSLSGYGRARISSFFPKLMWSEGFTIAGPPLQHARLLFPHGDHVQFCDMIEEYEKHMKRLAVKLTRLILLSLGVGEDGIPWLGRSGDTDSESSAVIQLNSYPACPDPDRAMGLAPHTDSTLLTILHQNAVAGLHVFRDGCGWVQVPSIPGMLVVNIGDLLHVMSNGSYPSVLHRVAVNRSNRRLSIAFLYGPPPEASISPHPELLAEGHSPLYRAVTWKEYLATKAKFFDQTLPMLRY